MDQSLSSASGENHVERCRERLAHTMLNMIEALTDVLVF